MERFPVTDGVEPFPVTAGVEPFRVTAGVDFACQVSPVSRHTVEAVEDSSYLIADAEVNGVPHCSVLLSGGRIEAIWSGKVPKGALRRGSMHLEVIDARGGALLPGLHDHHLHLFAMAARRQSVDLGHDAVRDRDALARILRACAARVGPGELVRGYGYHEAVAGPLDASGLDSMLGDLADRSVRVQHVSGHRWICNHAAIDQLLRSRPELIGHPGIEIDGSGQPTGLITRADELFRLAESSSWPDLGGVSMELAKYGITGVTDAGVTNGLADISELARQLSAGRLRMDVCVMGRPDLAGWTGRAASSGDRGVVPVVGPVKVVVEDGGLDPGVIAAQVSGAGRRGVAIHATSREALVAAVAGLRLAARLEGEASPGLAGALEREASLGLVGGCQAAGAAPGGLLRARGVHVPWRIEHASVAPYEVVGQIRELGVTVVTQPGFVYAHGDRYLAEVETPDVEMLYRLRSWRDAGVPLAFGSDAPFGPADPWLSIRAARDRMTSAGALLARHEHLSPGEALAGYLLPLLHPASVPRRLVAGQPASCCLLKLPWRDMAMELAADAVRCTWWRGHITWPG